jgi:two-component system cell cycle sensor histidine kinase/response regulator CckA
MGTSLKVCLPASPNKPAPQPAVSAPRPKRVPDRAKVSTILVIDDEEMVRKVAAMTLARYGYEVLEAENGQDALEVLADSPSLPSLALLDLAMPVMGGDELMPILAARYPDLKVILSSGYPEEEARKVLPSAAVAGFLQKPYTGVILAEKIEQALK